MRRRERQAPSHWSETRARDSAPIRHFQRGRVLLMGVLVISRAALIAYLRLWLRTAIVSTHFAYVPVVLASLWWGRRAVWVAVFLGVWMLALGQLAPTGGPVAADATRMFCFWLVAFAVGIVKLHGGEISAKSADGRWSVFTVQLSAEVSGKDNVDRRAAKERSSASMGG